MPRYTRPTGRHLRLPNDVKLDKRGGVPGWDLQGQDIAEITVGMAKGAPYWGLSVVGVNNQRKSILFDSPDQLDALITMLKKFRQDADWDSMLWKQAVRGD